MVDAHAHTRKMMGHCQLHCLWYLVSLTIWNYIVYNVLQWISFFTNKGKLVVWTLFNINIFTW